MPDHIQPSAQQPPTPTPAPTPAPTPTPAQTEQDNSGFAHFVRAALAIGLTLTLPIVLYVKTSGDAQILQVYLDALAAVVAFYFGASSNPS